MGWFSQRAENAAVCKLYRTYSAGMELLCSVAALWSAGRQSWVLLPLYGDEGDGRRQPAAAVGTLTSRSVETSANKAGFPRFFLIKTANKAVSALLPLGSLLPQALAASPRASQSLCLSPAYESDSSLCCSGC